MDNLFPNSSGIFRRPPGNNIAQTQSITIRLDSISINSGWEIVSGGKTDTLTVSSVNGGTSDFSVNGGGSL
jgi:hypothetical protein